MHHFQEGSQPEKQGKVSTTFNGMQAAIFTQQEKGSHTVQSLHKSKKAFLLLRGIKNHQSDGYFNIVKER